MYKTIKTISVLISRTSLQKEVTYTLQKRVIYPKLQQLTLEYSIHIRKCFFFFKEIKQLAASQYNIKPNGWRQFFFAI